MRNVVFVVCLFSFSAAVFAQQAQTGPNGFEFIAPLQISVGNDNNFLVDRTDPNERLLVLSLPGSVQPGAPDIRPKQLSDEVLTLTMPKIGYQNDSRRHEFFATWLPEFEIFRHNPDQNTMSNALLGNFTYFLARNIQISVGDTYRTSKDPARTLGNVFLLLPRSRFHENDFRGRFEIQPNAVTSLGIRYDNSYSRFGQTDQFQGRLLDTASKGYSFIVTRMLRPNQRIRATFSRFDIHPLSHQTKFSDAVDTRRSFEHPIHSAVLEYRWGLNPNTIAEFSGGVFRMDTGWNNSFHATIDRRVRDFWIGGGYSRSLSFQAGTPSGFAQGLGSHNVYDVILMRFRGQPTRRTAITFDTSISRDAAKNVATRSASLMGRARFDYRLSDRNVLFASLESYQQNTNSYVRSPLSRNRFVVGIQISLSSETERRTNHSNEDAQYVALTDHQRRRAKPE